MLDIKIPDIDTKLACDIDMPAGVSKWSIVGKVIDLTDSLSQKIKVFKKLSDKKVVCLWKMMGKDAQFTFEIENIKGNNDIASALNQWMFAKQEVLTEKYKGKDVKYYEKVYFHSPRLYEIRINKQVFKLNLRMAKLTEMWRNMLLEKKRAVKRNARIITLLRNEGYFDKLWEFTFERTLESNREVMEEYVEEMVRLCVLTEQDPPKPIEPPFFFRVGEIRKIWDHMIKLTRQRGKEDDDDLLSVDGLNDFLNDDFDEIVTKEEREEVLAKMKRKIRKIARQFWKARQEEKQSEEFVAEI